MTGKLILNPAQGTLALQTALGLNGNFLGHIFTAAIKISINFDNNFCFTKLVFLVAGGWLVMMSD
jgi:hypothetical protein